MSIRRGTETGLVKALLTLLRLRGWFAWRNHTTGVRRTDRAGRSFWAFHGVRGAPDIFALCGAAGSRRGLFLAVETKSETGRLTAEQEWFLAAVRDYGGLACCVRSVKELEDFLEENGF